jgi:hypothetical protein
MIHGYARTPASLYFLFLITHSHDNSSKSVVLSYAEGEFGEFPKVPVTLSIMLLFGIMVLFGVKVCTTVFMLFS